jgi:hypothetical protein
VTEPQYVCRLLHAYCTLPDTGGRIRPADRQLANRLFREAVPLELVLLAFRLALSRRRARPDHAAPLPPVRSLHYFLPIIKEVINLPQDYLHYLRAREAHTADDQHDGGELRKQPSTRTS